MAEQLAALSTQYKKSGQQLAFGNDDPFQRALLLSACIDESDVKLFAEHVVDAYSNIDAAAKAVSKGALTGYDKKTIAGKQAVEVLSAKEAFDPAYRITADLLEHSEFSGMQAVETMLSCGNAGPNGELLNKIDEDYFYRIPQPGEPSYAHLANVENYLTGIAGYGIDISQTGTSYSRLWSQMIRQTDRRQPLASRLAVAYAAKGNTALSDLFATEVRQHTQRGKMLVRLAELTSDPDERRERAHQIKIASYEALDCQGNCSDNYCDPDRDSQELILAAARLFITSGEPSRGKAFLRNLENSLRFPTGRFNAYAALYDRLADENYRQKAVNLLPYILRGDIAAGVTLVAKADIKYNQTLPSISNDAEQLPQLATELPALFAFQQLPSTPDSSQDDQLKQLLELVVAERQSDEERATMSSIKKDHRSIAYAAMAKVLASHGLVDSTKEMIFNTETDEQRVRAFMGVACAYDELVTK